MLDPSAAPVTRSCAQSGAYLKFLQTALRPGLGGTAGALPAAISEAGVLDGFTVNGFGGVGGTILCRLAAPRGAMAAIPWDKVGGTGRLRDERESAISRVLSRAIIHLGRTSPYASSDLPGSLCEPQVRGRSPARFPIWSCSRWGLPCHRVLPPARCALTAPFHPYLPAFADIGGVLSVALSVGSRPPGVTWHLALWSPDFPPRRETPRLPGRLPTRLYQARRPTPTQIAARVAARVRTVPCGSAL